MRKVNLGALFFILYFSLLIPEGYAQVTPTLSANTSVMSCPSQVELSVANSQNGFTYTLRNNADSTAIGNSQFGTGGALTFLGAYSFDTETYHVLEKPTNYALNFDGVDDYVEAPNPGIPTSGDFTVAFWGKYDTDPSSTMEFFSQGTSGNALYIGNNVSSDVFRLGDDWQNPGIAIPTDGDWHHYALVKSSTNTIFYVDGDSVAALGSAIDNPGSTELRFGRQYGGLEEYLDGSIDHFTVWDKVLSKSEIEQTMTTDYTGNEANLYAFYNFNEGSGTTLTDLTARGNNGVLQNMAGTTEWVSGNSSIQTSETISNVVTVTGRAGTVAEPHLVCDINDLQLIYDPVNGTSYLSDHFELQNDIDASETVNWNNGDGLTPIGNLSSQFSGSLNGQGYCIEDLFISRAISDQGLFGVTALSSQLTNLCLVNILIGGNDNIGGLVGQNLGTISNSYTTGYIGADNNAGGLVGSNSGTISTSYSTVYVNAVDNVGGLVGKHFGTISNSYAKGTVLGNISNFGDFGGLVGELNAGVIINSYATGSVSFGENIGGLIGDGGFQLAITNGNFWDIQTSNVPFAVGIRNQTIFGITGKTTSEMKDVSTFTAAGWDFDSTWYQRSTENDGYPQLQFMVADSGTAPVISSISISGTLALSNTVTATYTFTDAEGDADLSTFQWFTADDASGTNKTAISGAIDSTFTPTVGEVDKFLGVQITPKDPFNTGILVESSYTDPVINPFSDGVGTKSDPFQIRTVQELQDIEQSLSAHYILVNNIDASETQTWNSGQGFDPIGTLEDPFTGTFNGQGFVIDSLFIDRDEEYVGLFGVMGNVLNVKIEQVGLTNVDITGRSKVGGLAGSTSELITNTFVTGSVTAAEDTVGGLVGIHNSGETISFSYSTALVNGSGSEGGLMGVNNGTVTGSFWNTETSGQSTSAGGTNKTTAEMKEISTFTAAGWDFDTIWDIDSLVNDGYPFLRNFFEFNTIINGEEGWRMLAAPNISISYSSLFSDIWTQGFPGANQEDGNASILLWDEPTQSWIAPESSGSSPKKGQGFLSYLFADDNNDGTPEGFPKRLSFVAEPDTSSAPVIIPVTYTSLDSTELEGWNFVGNPFNETINWDAEGVTKINLSNSMYVWSDSAGGGQGAYLTWNGITGTLPDGKIAPWQGFWVKAMNENPALSISKDAASEGGAYRKEKDHRLITFTLTDGNYHSQSVINFNLYGDSKLDEYDAYALASLNDTSLSIGLENNGDEAMSILTLQLGYLYEEVDFRIESRGADSLLTLSWRLENIDVTYYNLSLTDHHENTELELSSNGSIEFVLPALPVSAPDSLMIPEKPYQFIGAGDTTHTRFSLKITSNDGLSTESPSDIPKTIVLSQNYPNPFNPGTTIKYGVPKTGHIVLEVFNVLGQKVAALVDEQVAAGYHQINFDAGRLASGIYIYRLSTNQQTITKKMMLIK